MRTESIVQILVRRDGMTKEDALSLVREAKDAVADGEDPEDVCHEWFGLEPDYAEELIF